jgi:hypothetical protein
MRIKFDLKNEIVPADGTLGCLLNEAATSVRRRFFQPSDKTLTRPCRLDGLPGPETQWEPRNKPLPRVARTAVRLKRLL